jgi:hypothetical protein
MSLRATGGDRGGRHDRRARDVLSGNNDGRTGEGENDER